MACPRSRVARSRRLESFAHRFGIARDHGQISACGLIGLGLALLPIPERAEGYPKPGRELLLGEAECAAHDLDLRNALHSPLTLWRQGLGIRVGESCGVDLFISHGAQRLPIGTIGRKGASRAVRQYLHEGAVREASGYDSIFFAHRCWPSARR